MDKKQTFNLVDMIDCMPKPENHKQCVVTAIPDDAAVTMAYVPFQLDKTSYDPEKALSEGTLFPCLNKPFCGRRILNG